MITPGEPAASGWESSLRWQSFSCFAVVRFNTYPWVCASVGFQHLTAILACEVFFFSLSAVNSFRVAPQTYWRGRLCKHQYAVDLSCPNDSHTFTLLWQSHTSHRPELHRDGTCTSPVQTATFMTTIHPPHHGLHGPLITASLTDNSYP